VLCTLAAHLQVSLGRFWILLRWRRGGGRRTRDGRSGRLGRGIREVLRGVRGPRIERVVGGQLREEGGEEEQARVCILWGILLRGSRGGRGQGRGVGR